ncbi:MAG: hypothetical protein HDT30_08890 [Clostridiales bacterium]|nr:hypothetical protein [Clostridiales bacterium]
MEYRQLQKNLQLSIYEIAGKDIVNLEKIRMEKSKGSITIYLTLIIVVMLALIASFLENARVKVAGYEVKRALKGAMDAELTNYYRPLYEDYGLFFMDKGIDSDSLEFRVIAKEIKGYIENSLSTKTTANVFGITLERQGTDLYQTQIQSLQMNSAIRAVDYEGGLVEDEVVQFMKYQVSGELLQKMLNCCKLLDKSESVSLIMNEESKAEESLEDASKQLLKLIEQVEGLKCKDKGLIFENANKLATTGSFAKQLCGKSITKGNVGIDPQIVYQSLQSKYINGTKKLEEIQELLKELKREHVKQETRKAEEAKKEEERKAKEEEEAKKNKNTAMPTATIKPTVSIKPTDTPKPTNTPKPTKTPEPPYDFSKTVKSVNEKQSELKTVVANSKKKMKEAISTIGKIEKKLETIDSKINKFEETLTEQKKNLSTEEFKNMNGQEKELRNDVTCLKNAVRMKEKLSTNLKILESLEGELKKKVKQEETSYTDKLTGIQEQISVLKSYDISSLKFSYKNIKNQNASDPSSALKNLGSSVLSIVVEDSSKISKKEISNPDYYYKNYKGKSKGLKNIDTGAVIKGDNAKNIFSDASDVFRQNGEKSKQSSLTNTLIYQAYLNQYFQSYVSKESKFQKTPLKYEQEYILCGKASDKENLQSVIDRILLMRTVTNFSYLLTNTQGKEKAYATAAALVGFTGIEPLIRATQMGILLVWSYEEGLVDVAALLHGSKIPLVKSKSNFMLTYSDMLTISKKKIQSKAKELGKNKLGVAGISYEQFIDIFLFLENQTQKNYRTMDLIEENMKLRHSKKFSMEDCIYALKVSCNYMLPAKFMAWNFMEPWKKKGDSWSFTINQNYSY